MEELIKKFETACGKKVKETYNFPATETFNAFREAEDFAKGLGYKVGIMCGGEPIAIAKDFGYIAKWYNINSTKRELVEGGLLSKDFRDGDVLLVIFE